MPFIIDHRSPALPPNHEVAIRAVPISSRAVATIDDAITHAADLLSSSTLWDDPTDELQGAEYREYAAEVQTIDERGGTIGPLPDGTTIEVRPVTRAEIIDQFLVDFATLPNEDWPWTTQRLCDAYNAHRESTHADEARERATCSTCLARTYRQEECVCEGGGDAEDYDEVLAELEG